MRLGHKTGGKEEKNRGGKIERKVKEKRTKREMMEGIGLD